MRHGHKSGRRRFEGSAGGRYPIPADHRRNVLHGNTRDSKGFLELLEQSEASDGVPVAEDMCDNAYGDDNTKKASADAGRRDRSHFPK